MTRKCKVCGRKWTGTDRADKWCQPCAISWMQLVLEEGNEGSAAAEWGAKRRAAAQKAGGK